MRILVTAGPTREFIDPVRFITNLSTGAMGYAIAKAARRKKHKVILISGPANFKPPAGIKTIKVISAGEMFRQVKKYFKKSDCLIMSAAVSDVKPKQAKRHKIKKQNLMRLALAQNPDILQWAGENKSSRLTVGFCMETEQLIKRAKQKLQAKKADIIVANSVGNRNNAFGNDMTKVFIIDAKSRTQKIGPTRKENIAQALIGKVEEKWLNTAA